MDDDSSELIQQLLIEIRSNSEGQEAVKVVERLMGNIASDPSNDKYRSIRTDSNVYTNKIAPVAAAGALLGALGWVERGSERRIEYPKDVSQAHLTACLRLLGLGNGDLAGGAPATNPGGQNEIAGRLRAQMQHVKLYERPDLQDKARKCVPTFTLYKEAHAAAQAGGTNVRDELMKKLLHWYKNDFFTWMNSPKCHRCQAETQAVGMGQPTSDDLKYGASRVELYRCTQCGSETRFPRYNDPGKLLETRTGRCGEWANCFTLICRALGYDARYVLDFTDHVWTEVFSEGLGRWVHCDSCEAAFDQPLVYETGWGKKLNYIFAFSAEEVVDVARRYTNNFGDLCTRRDLATESWLADFVNRCDREQKAALSTERRQHREKMRQKEMEELHKAHTRHATEDESVGRQSGSLAWREARGETGKQ